MNRYEKFRMIICLVVLIIVIVFLSVFAYFGYRFWDSFSYPASVFNQSYGINFDLFGNGFFVYISDSPQYFLSADGCLYDVDKEVDDYELIQITDRIRPIRLTEKNFDNIISDDAAWLASNIDAASLREHNVRTWRGEDYDCVFYYIMLQDNKDILLCSGYGEITEITWLNPIESGDAIYDYIADLNQKEQLEN